MANPTPEQVEAAAKVMARAHGVRFDVVPGWLEPYKEDARAALVAAAGAEPQAIRSDYCGDALPNVKSRSHLPTTPSIQRLGFDADKIVSPECVKLAHNAPHVRVDEANLAVDVPPIPFGPEGVPEDKANAGYYRAAAKNIRYHASRGRSVMGSNLTEAVARLCDATADALYERHRLRGGAQ